MGKIKRFLPFLLAVQLVFSLTACQTSENSYYEKSFFAMNTYMILRVDGESAEAQIAAAEEKIRAIETDLEVRVFTPTGLLSQLNAAEGEAVTVSDEIIALLQTALTANVETDGAFDITLYPLSELWDFSGEGHIPTAEELAETLKRTGCENVVIDAAAKTVRLENGAQIDLCALAKGYTADVITSDLKADGVKSALLNVGGNIVAIGKRDNGEAWRVGVADPKNTSAVVGILSVADQSVVTSA
ncbi:MAG: FAD:protein FMN transferase, partial [Clostridia bacterium]|nr:FAD:protein FMN transferase [Clostridia bacterium]